MKKIIFMGKKLLIKKLIFLMLFFVLILLNNAFSINPKDIKYITFYTNLEGKELQYMQKYVQEFNSDPKHPIIQIKYKNFSNTQDFIKNLNNNTDIDVALINNYQLTKLYKKLLPIDEYIGKTTFKYITLKHDTFKNVFKSICRQNKDVISPYLIPYSAQTLSLMYNKQLDNDKKLKIRKYWSWNTFIKYKNKFKDFYILPIIIKKDNNLQIGQYFYMFLKLSKKGLKPIYKKEDLKQIDKKTITTAYNLLKNFCIKESDYNENKTIFINFIFMKNIKNLNLNTWEIYAIPKYKNYSSILQTKGFAIFNNQNTIKQKKYVLMFINFINKYEREKERALTLNQLPVNKQVYLHPDFLNKIKKDSSRKYFLYQIKNAIFLPQIDKGIEYIYILGETVKQSYLNNLNSDNFYKLYIKNLKKLFPELIEEKNESKNNKKTKSKK